MCFLHTKAESQRGKGFRKRAHGARRQERLVGTIIENMEQTRCGQGLEEVYQSAPPVERYRTKYPRAVTIKYAEFMRKQTNKNLAMGGLPAIAILNQKLVHLSRHNMEILLLLIGEV